MGGKKMAKTPSDKELSKLTKATFPKLPTPSEMDAASNRQPRAFPSNRVAWSGPPADSGSVRAVFGGQEQD